MINCEVNCVCVSVLVTEEGEGHLKRNVSITTMRQKQNKNPDVITAN